MQNLILKSSAQLLKMLKAAKENYTVDHIESAKILNDRKKLTTEFRELLPDTVVYWEDVAEEAAPAAKAAKEPKASKAPKDPNAAKPKNATSRVKYENPRPIVIGDIVEIDTKDGKEQGEVVRTSTGHAPDQIYFQVKTANGTRSKRDYATKLLVTESEARQEERFEEQAAAATKAVKTEPVAKTEPAPKKGKK